MPSCPQPLCPVPWAEQGLPGDRPGTEDIKGTRAGFAPQLFTGRDPGNLWKTITG